MKKEYIQPKVKAHVFKNRTILTGSVNVDDGNTSEQNAKGFGLGFSEEDEEDM